MVNSLIDAGREAHGPPIAWLIYFLHQDLEAQHKVKLEVARHAPEVEPLSPEHLATMSYLDACINETLRLKPVAPFMPMESIKDMVIGDVAVSAGTLIWGVQRHDGMDPTRVAQPEAFEPQRWLDEGNAHGAETSLKHLPIPFGAGPRVCHGRHLALTEIKMATAMLMTHFDLASVDTPDGLPPRELMAFTMAPVGLHMRLRQR